MMPDRNQGVLAEVSPIVLYYGSIWVLIADGIFAGLAVSAREQSLLLGILAALATSIGLLPVAVSRLASWSASVAAALVYGTLIYFISAIPLLAAIVLIQIGLMHYVAFAILATHWREPVRSWLKTATHRTLTDSSL
jgi:hypothetical protein